MDKETTGDVIKINITPKGTTFPWIKIFRYPHGLRARKSVELPGIDAAKRLYNRETLAKAIGERIIQASKILSAEFPE